MRSLAVTYSDHHHIEPHTHPWGQLVYAEAGVMRVVTQGAAWLVPPTRAIWLPAGLAHEIHMKGAVSLRTLYLNGRLGRGLPTAASALEVTPLLRELILHILKRGMLDSGSPAHARLAGLLIDLLVQARAEDLFLPLPHDPRARVLAERIQAEPGERADLAALAPAAGASLRTLQRLFPAETGLSLQAWRQKARLTHAAAALSAGAAVTVVALDCGYDSQSAFITAFRRQFGATPGRYRARP
ncbi:MAG: helix-turn-helix transcriptional regulator [Pseudomonadota bacterium]